MAIEFVKDEAAAQRHAAGLDLALRGDFAEAHNVLAEARRKARRSDLLAQQLPSLVLQLAHINRDDAFTFTREAIAEHKDAILEDSYHRMARCVDATAALIKDGAAAYTPEAWGLLESEHEATMDLAERISVVNEILFDRAVSVIPLSHFSSSSDLPQDAWHYLQRGPRAARIDPAA